MRKAIFLTVLLIVASGLASYGLYCGAHMLKFIGTDQYWSNPWFYKAHACLFALIILQGLMLKGRIRRARRPSSET
jgi:hypothetical protein